jgi:hypothetical protein
MEPFLRTNASNAAETPQSGLDRRSHDLACPLFHAQDVDIALDIDHCDFSIGVDFENGRPVARVEGQPKAESGELILVTRTDNLR